MANHLHPCRRTHACRGGDVSRSLGQKEEARMDHLDFVHLDCAHLDCVPLDYAHTGRSAAVSKLAARVKQSTEKAAGLV